MARDTPEHLQKCRKVFERYAEDSLSLKRQGVILNTNFYWICMIEEIPYTDEMEEEDVIQAIKDFYRETSDELRVGRKDEFDEFTYVICPAPTYIDLIK